MNLSHTETMAVLNEVIRRATALRGEIAAFDPLAVPPEALASSMPLITQDVITWQSATTDEAGTPDWYFTIPLHYLFDAQAVVALLREYQRRRTQREKAIDHAGIVPGKPYEVGE